MLDVVVAAAYPTITSNVTDGCISEDQNVRLTCQVIYNGTDLMPLVMTFLNYSYVQINHWWDYHYIVSNDTSSVSSVYQLSLTFTATGRNIHIYACRVTFSSPIGVVVPGVQRQYTNWFQRFPSPLYVSRTVAGETVSKLYVHNCLENRKSAYASLYYCYLLGLAEISHHPRHRHDNVHL